MHNVPAAPIKYFLHDQRGPIIYKLARLNKSNLEDLVTEGAIGGLTH